MSSLYDEAVAIRNARFIIEQALIHRSEDRRAESEVRVMGEGVPTPVHQPCVWERCKFSWWGPEQSPAAKQMFSNICLEVYSFHVHRWFCQKWGGTTFTCHFGACPQSPSLAIHTELYISSYIFQVSWKSVEGSRSSGGRKSPSPIDKAHGLYNSLYYRTSRDIYDCDKIACSLKLWVCIS